MGKQLHLTVHIAARLRLFETLLQFRYLHIDDRQFDLVQQLRHQFA